MEKEMKTLVAGRTPPHGYLWAFRRAAGAADGWRGTAAVYRLRAFSPLRRAPGASRGWRCAARAPLRSWRRLSQHHFLRLACRAALPF